MKKFRFLFIVLVLFSVFFAENAMCKNINRVKIIGNKRYNDLAYKKMITADLGKELTAEDKNKIVQDIFASNLVDDVKIDYRNNIITITVVERFLIKKITFRGNKKLKDDTIKQNLKLKVKNSFSSSLLKEDLKFIRSYYNNIGLINTRINYEVKEFVEDGLVEVIFNIEESKKAKINSITFVGNKNISSSNLKDQIYSKENRFFRFGNRIIYNEDYLDYDVYLLSQLYLKHGYLDFDLISKNAFFNKKENNFDIVFTLREGEKYFNGNISLVNNVDKFDASRINDKISKIKEDDVFDYSLIRNTVDTINSILAKEGALHVYIRQSIIPNSETKKVKITFILDYNKNNYIGGININNNTKTYDYVIRQQMLLGEGDLFNKDQMDKSIQKIRNLGFFKSANYVYKENPKSTYDIDVNIEEAPTGSVGGSIGYSTLDRENISFNYSQRNLFGKALGVDSNISFYRYSRKLSFDISKPEIYNTNINMNAGIYFNDNKDNRNSLLNIGYNSLSEGMYNNFQFQLTDNISQRVGYSYASQVLNNISLEYQGVVNTGRQRTFELTNSFHYDTRDYFFSPTKGFLISLDTNLAGLFGNRNYIKNVLYGAYYRSIQDNVVLKLEGKVGFISSYGDRQLFPTDGFYLGGYSMRGFESAGLGPKVKPINPSTPLKDGYGVGGTNLYFINAELKIPLGLPREIELSAILFFNAGTVTGIEDNKNVNRNVIVDSGSIRSAAGISFMWRTPINLNISIDFSKIISKEDYDLTRNFRFNIGKTF